jgi:hypothetical protein
MSTSVAMRKLSTPKLFVSGDSISARRRDFDGR